MIPWQDLAASQGFQSPGEWLTHLTQVEDRHQHEIAKHVGCDLSTVRRAFDRYEVPRKPRGGSRKRLYCPLQTLVEAIPQWRTAPLRDLCGALGGGHDRSAVNRARKKLLRR